MLAIEELRQISEFNYHDQKKARPQLLEVKYYTTLKFISQELMGEAMRGYYKKVIFLKDIYATSPSILRDDVKVASELCEILTAKGFEARSVCSRFSWSKAVAIEVEWY